MRLAIIGGASEDERHLVRLAEKAGQSLTFVRPPAAEVVLLSSGQRLEPVERQSDPLGEVAARRSARILAQRRTLARSWTRPAAT